MNDQAIARSVIQHISDGSAVQVKIFAPRATSHGDDWSCKIITEKEDGTLIAEKHCYGVDAVQAIQSGFAYLRAEVDDKYIWHGEPAVLGFPAPLPNVFGIEFYRKMATLVLQEESKFVKSKKRKT